MGTVAPKKKINSWKQELHPKFVLFIVSPSIGDLHPPGHSVTKGTICRRSDLKYSVFVYDFQRGY